MRDLVEELGNRTDQQDVEPLVETEMKLAIVGRRNVGKSTLINSLAGEDRVIVSDIAGTTRDAIDVQFKMEGHEFTAIDTAGLRRKKSFADDIEFYAYRRMLTSIRRADVALFLIDATTEISQVDQKLGQELQRQFAADVPPEAATLASKRMRAHGLLHCRPSSCTRPFAQP